jgi:hypothetical protein
MRYCRTHNRELHIGRAYLGSILVDILDPFVVALQSIRGNADDFDVSLCEVFCAPSDFSELGRAHRGEVTGVGEQDGL